MKTRLLFLLFLLPSALFAQKFFTRSGSVSFYSTTPVEDIEAYNTSANSVFDTESGAIQFAVLMKSFMFEKALMQEHFNENYVESDEYPKAIFKGTISTLEAIDFNTTGIYNVEVSGTMELHGVEQPMTASGTIEVTKEGKIKAKSDFMLRPEDYEIEIPSVVRDKIAREVKVTVDLAYQPLKR